MQHIWQVEKFLSVIQQSKADVGKRIFHKSLRAIRLAIPRRYLTASHKNKQQQLKRKKTHRETCGPRCSLTKNLLSRLRLLGARLKGLCRRNCRISTWNVFNSGSSRTNSSFSIHTFER